MFRTYTTVLGVAPYALLASAIPFTHTAVRQTTSGPAIYPANATLGGGDAEFNVPFVDTPHFRLYNAVTPKDIEHNGTIALKYFEAAHTCFVETLGWRSAGRSYLPDFQDVYFKTNVYVHNLTYMNNLTGTQYEQRDIGISFLDILDLSLDSIWPVHEYGHALTLSESSWNDDENTWDWWETVATYISDEFHSTSTCRAAKASHGLSTEPWPSQINPTFLHENTHLILVDGNRTTGNRRAAFPFISYLNNNPDKYTGLGKQTLLNMLRKYKVGSNDTPFHVLATILAGTGTTVQKAVGRYWAHMAYFDIGHPSAHAVFLSERPNIVYDSLHANGTVKSEKAPRYMGANIIPLKIKGSNITVALQTSGQYTATLVVKSGEKLRYVDVVNGKGRVAVAKSDEVSLVVAYTPELIMYNSAAITAEMYANALQYSVKFTGASVA